MKKYYRIHQIGLWVFLAVMGADIFLKWKWPTVAAIAVICVTSTYAFLHYKCPHCGKRLNIKKLHREEICPYCGKSLE